MFDGFFIWLIIAVLIIIIFKCGIKFYAKKTQAIMFKALFDSIENGGCYIYKQTKNYGRPKYSVVIGKSSEKKEYIIEYHTITYDSFFRRYEENEILLKDELTDFLRKYEKTDVTLDYFKYEKYS
jgi:hypothetical protein